MKVRIHLATVVGTVLVTTSVVATRPVKDVTKRPYTSRVVALSGTYVDRSNLAHCSIFRTNDHAPALHLAHVGSVLSIRVAPSASVRVLRIERPESVRRSVGRRSGLARWEESTLVVETAAPAFPLWGGPVTVGGSRLIEAFLLTPEDDLVYRTWYTPAGQAATVGPWEVRLAKCKSGAGTGGRAAPPR